MMSLNEDSRTRSAGFSPEWLADKSAWLSEQRSLHGDGCKFFVIAGSLFKFAQYDYAMGSVAFFNAILGLEKALKLHYRANEGYLRQLLVRAVEEGIFHDNLFGELPRLDSILPDLNSRHGLKKSVSHCTRLAILIPEQRNLYFHGTYLLNPDYFHLTVQLRTLADALDTRRAYIEGYAR